MSCKHFFFLPYSFQTRLFSFKFYSSVSAVNIIYNIIKGYMVMIALGFDNASQVKGLPYLSFCILFGYEMEGFPCQNNGKNLDPSQKMDVDFQKSGFVLYRSAFSVLKNLLNLDFLDGLRRKTPSYSDIS